MCRDLPATPDYNLLLESATAYAALSVLIKLVRSHPQSVWVRQHPPSQ